VEKPYTPFQILALLKYDGDFSSAAKELAQRYDMGFEAAEVKEEYLEKLRAKAKQSASNKEQKPESNTTPMVELEDVSAIKLDFRPGRRVFSGYPQIDNHVGGFRSGKAYRVSGTDKSGKSTFLASIVSNMMNENIVGVINNEEGDEEFLARFVAIEKAKSKNEVTEQEVNEWRSRESTRQNFKYVGKEKLLDKNMLIDIEKCLAYVEKFIEVGARVIIFDNLTTLAANSDNGYGYTHIGKAATRLVNLASINDVTVFFVIHVRPSAVEVSDDPKRVKGFIDNGTPGDIFVESIETLIKRPKRSDIYGGGVSGATTSGGTIFVWRPYQNFPNPELSSLTSIILDGFRNTNPKEVDMYFMGDQSRFEERPIELSPEALNKLRKRQLQDDDPDVHESEPNPQDGLKN